MMRVVVILVDRQHGRRDINNGGLARACAPDEPVVPSTAAKREGKKVGVQPFGESEIIDQRRCTQNAGGASLLSQAALPGRIAEIDWLGDVQIRALADFLNRSGKIVEKNDVRIHVTKKVVCGIALALRK